MLTWRLWRALRNPDDGNPVFERVRVQAIDLPGKRYLLWLSPLYRVLVVLLPAFVVLVAPAALLLLSNLLGALVAFNIMTTISREREQRTYDLLALLPIGLGAVNWQIACACTYRLDAIDRLARLRTLAIITLILLIFYFARFTILTSVTLLTLMLALNFDAIQSLIMGCLSGMLAQEFREQGAPFAALAIFAFIQIIVVYLPITVTAILLFDDIRPSGIYRWSADSLLAVIILGLLFALREVIIQVMWRQLERRLV